MDIENLTIGEIAAIEKYSGKKMGDMGTLEDGEVDTRFLLALALVAAKRRGYPQASMEDVEQLTIDEITALLEMPEKLRQPRSAIATQIAAELPPIGTPAAGESNGATPRITQGSLFPLVSAPSNTTH